MENILETVNFGVGVVGLVGVVVDDVNAVVGVDVDDVNAVAGKQTNKLYNWTKTLEQLIEF